MKSIRIENLRCLKDTAEIPLKNLNVLLGTNSSGKSTFLRTFPLLRQSIEVRKTGPILWYGDYVDFGDFDVAVNKESDEITFHITIQITAKNEKYKMYRNSYNFIDETDLTIVINIKGSHESSYIKSMTISYFDQIASIDLAEDHKIKSCKINNIEYKQHISDYAAVPRLGILPLLLMPVKDNETPNLFRYQIDDKIISDIAKLLKLRKSPLDEILIGLGFGSKLRFLEKLRTNTRSPNLNKIVSNWKVDDSDFIELNNRTILWLLPNLIEQVDDMLSQEIKNFYYTAPLRAFAQRYYRRQDLAISEVDFQGKNLAMFISSMSSKTKSDFQKWVSSIFGFYPDTKSSEGHISLKLVDDATKEDYNIADRGFGYSQILPIITQLWSVVNEKRKYNRPGYTNEIIFTIEQPELHLHPAMQAKLIDAFISSIKLAEAKGIVLKLIIETHSQTMVNRIGHRIAKNELKASDTSIVFFEASSNSAFSNVRLAEFTNEGILEDWPIGFFDPQDI